MWFEEDPKKDTYRELMDYLFKEAEEFSLDIYNRNYSEEAVKLFYELEPYIINIDYLKIYRNNSLDLWDKKRYYFKTNEETLEILKKYNDEGFFAWVCPKLFDDLCYNKKEKIEWICTKDQERIAYIKNETEEEIENMKKIKGLKLGM
ncbi:MAG: hypothetical protein K5986_07700 [Clostridium sp.]|nr:hypothetical protein [Clostridium sp.]